MVHSFFRWYVNAPLVFLIAGGLVVGILLAVFVPASMSTPMIKCKKTPNKKCR